eukprot:9100231-Alexandrium_andersonii.AAC.1
MSQPLAIAVPQCRSNTDKATGLGMSIASAPPYQCMLPFNYLPVSPTRREAGQEVSAFVLSPSAQDPMGLYAQDSKTLQRRLGDK